MESTGSLKYAEEKSIEYMQDSWRSIEEVLAENEYKGEMKLLLEYIVNREI